MTAGVDLVSPAGVRYGPLIAGTRACLDCGAIVGTVAVHDAFHLWLAGLSREVPA